MKALLLPAGGIAALLLLAPASASAQVLPGGGIAGPLYPQPGHGSLYPTPIPRQDGVRGLHGPRGGRHHGGFIAFPYIYEEPEVIHDVVVVHDQPAEPAAPPPPPAPPRKPWVLGRTYSSLPAGCMKMVAAGSAYFLCSGDWYRQVGAGSAAQYKAVAQP